MKVERCESLVAESLPRGMHDFFRHNIHMRKPGQRCFVARDFNGSIIGAFRYQIRGAVHLRSVRALGTWVKPDFRGQGIGRSLWRAMLAAEKPRRVRVATISKGGHALVSTLVAEAPIIIHANIQ